MAIGEHARLCWRFADGMTAKSRMLSRFPDMAGLFESPETYDMEAFERLRMAETIGRPLGDKAFQERIEARTGRRVAAAKRGPKGKDELSALSP